MTLAETKELITFAREQRIQEISVGDIHVLFTASAFVVPVVEPTVTNEMTAAQPLTDDMAAQLLDDPDLFLHADGGPVVPS
jgi:hypothetical protein